MKPILYLIILTSLVGCTTVGISWDNTNRDTPLTTAAPVDDQADIASAGMADPSLAYVGKTPLRTQPLIARLKTLCRQLSTAEAPSWTLLSGKKAAVEARASLFSQQYARESNRSLVVFIDGTGNIDASSTNIWKLYTQATQRSCQAAVIPYYHQGLGTGGSITKIAGMAIGQGIDKHIRDGYHFIAKTYQPGDQIFIFGFSRGAYTARALNGMIEFVGLLDLQSLAKKNRSDKKIRKLIKSLYTMYSQYNDGKPQWEARLKRNIKSHIAKHQKTSAFKHYKTRPVKLTAIGVFDTVPALGVKRDDFPDNFRTNLFAREGYHALAIDEQRDDFRELRFDDRVDSNQTLKEVWFAGAHADVGGGYHDANGLENVSRTWMAQQFLKFGIFPTAAETPNCQRHHATCELGYRHDEFLDSKLFDKFGLHWRKVTKGDRVHGSVLCRYDTNSLPQNHPLREPDKRYRPENVYLPLEKHYTIEPYQCKH